MDFAAPFMTRFRRRQVLLGRWQKQVLANAVEKCVEPAYLREGLLENGTDVMAVWADFCGLAQTEDVEMTVAR
jgi:hypothetical protein